jgi:hypothetical protein
VDHACNPSYSGGRYQEDCGSKPARENSSQNPILKKPFTKRASGVAQGAGPEFKTPVPQKVNKINEKERELLYSHTLIYDIRETISPKNNRTCIRIYFTLVQLHCCLTPFLEIHLL